MKRKWDAKNIWTRQLGYAYYYIIYIDLQTKIKRI